MHEYKPWSATATCALPYSFPVGTGRYNRCTLRGLSFFPRSKLIAPRCPSAICLSFPNDLPLCSALMLVRDAGSLCKIGNFVEPLAIFSRPRICEYDALHQSSSLVGHIRSWTTSWLVMLKAEAKIKRHVEHTLAARVSMRVLHYLCPSCSSLFLVIYVHDHAG